MHRDAHQIGYKCRVFCAQFNMRGSFFIRHVSLKLLPGNTCLQQITDINDLLIKVRNIKSASFSSHQSIKGFRQVPVYWAYCTRSCRSSLWYSCRYNVLRLLRDAAALYRNIWLLRLKDSRQTEKNILPKEILSNKTTVKPKLQSFSHPLFQLSK